MKDWKAEALDLLQEAAKFAKVSESRNIATAAADVRNAMADEGLVALDASKAYAMVMDELFANGAFSARTLPEGFPIDLNH